jgi:hypothetical protein
MDIPLIVQPLRPKGKGWEQWQVGNLELVRRAYAIERWYNRGQEVQVLSSIEMVSGEGPDRPEFHLSISALPYMGHVKRASESLARWVLKEFDFTDYAQDNHVPNGIVRNYWRPVAENKSPVCHCVESEPKIVEDKGDFIWRP